jgi:hypothetical protein
MILLLKLLFCYISAQDGKTSSMIINQSANLMFSEVAEFIQKKILSATSRGSIELGLNTPMFLWMDKDVV